MGLHVDAPALLPLPGSLLWCRQLPINLLELSWGQQQGRLVSPTHVPTLVSRNAASLASSVALPKWTSSIKRNCPTWACHHCFGEAWSWHHAAYLPLGMPSRNERVGAQLPTLSVYVTWNFQAISNIRVAGDQDWDQDSEWEGKLPNAPDSPRSFVLWDGMSTWPSIWRLAPDVLSPRSLILVANDIKLVAVELKLQI